MKLRYAKDELVQQLYKEFQVPIHVRRHMGKVAELAVIIAEKFKKRGYKVDTRLLEIAALIHDTLRICDFQSIDYSHFQETISPVKEKIWQSIREKYGKMGHVSAIGQVLRQRKRNKLAELVEKHDFFAIDKLKTLEEKILYYADKRAEGDKSVELSERFEKGRKRNYNNEDLSGILTIEGKIYQLENELSMLLNEKPI